MKVQHLKQKNFRTTTWSGGTTTELFIWPNGSVFKNDDYAFRVSKATIEVETSTFTKLPGVKRIFTLLSGNVKLSHVNQHDSTLTALQQDSFSGDWTTRSIGMCSPLNLMMKENISGIVKVLTIDHRGILDLNAPPKTNLLLLYPTSNCLITLDKEYQVNAGELIVIEDFNSSNHTINGTPETNIISLQIQV